MKSEIEKRDENLRKLAEWRKKNPGMSDGGDIFDSQGTNLLADDEAESERTEIPETSEPVAFAYQPVNTATVSSAVEDKTYWAIAKIFKALAKESPMKMQRARVQQIVLDKQLSGQQLDELKNHPLVQKYIVLSREKLKSSGPLPEIWELKPEALESADLGFIFGQRKQEVETTTEPEVEAPADIPARVLELVKMDYAAFIVQPDCSLLPHRSGERGGADYEAKWRNEYAAWPGEFNSDGKWHKVTPKDYWGVQPSHEQMLSRRQLEMFLSGRFLNNDAYIFQQPSGTLSNAMGFPMSLRSHRGVFYDDSGRKLTVLKVPERPSERHHIFLDADGRAVWQVPSVSSDTVPLNIALPPIHEDMPVTVLHSAGPDQWRPEPPPPPPRQRTVHDKIYESMKAFTL